MLLAFYSGMKSLALLLSFILITSTAVAAGPMVSCQDVLGVVLSKQEINLRLAQEAGLHYLNAPELGYSRQQDRQGVFFYLDSNGKRISDPKVLERIEQLRIPPAWHNVWISADPLSHIQASGKDAKERSQALYHPKWETEVKDAAKFARMERFGKMIPRLHAAIDLDLQKDSDDPETRLAVVAHLLEVSGIRIGGEKYAQENEHYGLSTLMVKHVSHLDSKSVTFNFVGKEGVSHEITVADPRIARIVRRLMSGKDQDELLFGVRENTVNKYIKAHTSSEFSAKDIRTWVGTVTAAKTLFEAGVPQSEEDAKAAEKAAAVAASERLHNTPTTARDNYIDPSIFAAYRSGRLDQAFRTIATGDRPVEESAVLQLMQEKRTGH